MSIRAALGAGRMRVVGQLMIEGLVISGMAGSLRSRAGVRLVEAFRNYYGPRNLVPIAGVGINGWVVAFAIGSILE